MRRETIKLEDIINKIKLLQGQDINLEVSRGRKKTEYYFGKIENIYPSIFTVKPNNEKSSLSFSFADVLCGVVSLKSPEEPEETENQATT